MYTAVRYSIDLEEGTPHPTPFDLPWTAMAPPPPGSDGWALLILTALAALAAATACLRHRVLRLVPQLLLDLLPPRVEYPESQLPETCPAPAAAAAAQPGLFRPLALRGLTLRNRVIKAATFEACCDADGGPLASLIAHHAEVARGGTGLTVVAYASVSADGKSFGTQLQVRRRRRPPPAPPSPRSAA